MPELDKIAALYIELQKYIHAGDYEKAIKACNRLLHEVPDDELAFECKIIACVNLSRFQDALDFVRKNPTMIRNLSYEIAYCHYRLNQTTEAITVLDSISNTNDIRKKELYCQILYRLERYEECHDLYKEIVKHSTDLYEEERQSNVTAISASLKATNSKRKVVVEKGTTFEHQYNYACFLVAQDDYKSAEEVIILAEKTCETTLREEGTPEDDIQDELCIMKALRAYCCQMQGREAEAMRIYSAILKKKPTDNTIIIVVSNNIVCINRDQNIFESKKRVKAMNTDNIGYRLTAAQKLTMKLNECFFYLLTKQDDLCRNLYTTLLDNEGSNCDELHSIATCHNYLTERYEAVRAVRQRPCVKQNKDLDLFIRLGLSQAAIENNDVETGIELLRLLAVDVNYPLGIVSSLAVLFSECIGRTAGGQLLQNVISYFYETRSNDESLVFLWKQAAAFHIEGENYTMAENFLKQLLNFDTTDVLGLALTLTVFLHYRDWGMVHGLSESLPDPDISSLDVESLESANFITSIKYVKKVTRNEEDVTPIIGNEKSVVPNVSHAVVVKPKKKKTKLPRNYDPDRNLDPERWLPRYMRSGYKPRKTRRGKSDVGKGTQGAATGETMDAYDVSRIPSLNKTPTSARTPGGSETPRERRPAKKSRSK